ncbi:putative ATP-dependent helicase C23E6.02 [Wickerhamiella sorbophila]|uniref:Putative ATP-dependent helicase C23E6.02 n=1 Tax=Wickerhamiella sorbophila TaxID=45607 RepID=A0A2T0FFJ6_9ASCO|nr:putative ATP-dependent helicase C23E6.02 [Wickerhamiella sorbophila]PRT53750.1 putative ATP-dependent helicase C23E6.02 [Wickerhamiella sorbophila]
MREIIDLVSDSEKDPPEDFRAKFVDLVGDEEHSSALARSQETPEAPPATDTAEDGQKGSEKWHNQDEIADFNLQNEFFVSDSLPLPSSDHELDPFAVFDAHSGADGDHNELNVPEFASQDEDIDVFKLTSDEDNRPWEQNDAETLNKRQWSNSSEDSDSDSMAQNVSRRKVEQKEEDQAVEPEDLEEMSSGSDVEIVRIKAARSPLKVEIGTKIAVNPWTLTRKERNQRFKESLEAMTSSERSDAIGYRDELDSFAIGLTERAKELEYQAELAVSPVTRGFNRDMADKYRNLSTEVREVLYDLQLRRYSESSVSNFIRVSRARLNDKNKRIQRMLQDFQTNLNAQSRSDIPHRSYGASSESVSGTVGIEERNRMESEYAQLLDKIHNNVTPMSMPSELDVSDLEHQRLGLGWLVGVEKGPNHGGILADDMGLGKTIQSIALMYAHPPPSTGPRLTLIVCATALIQTWYSELHDRVKPEFRKRVYVHHRATNKSLLMNANAIERQYDVVITTYTTLLYETDAYNKRHNRPLPSIHWWRVILDEAHTIKNPVARTSIACASLRAVNRICLSGTPMQNNLFELWPLIRFLKIKPYWDSMLAFKSILPREKITMNGDRSTISEIQTESNSIFKTLLSVILLRRRKTTLINGRKILEGLPPKTTYSMMLTPSPAELESYREVEAGLIKILKTKRLALNEFSMSNILSALLRMRQQACHPYLIALTALIRGTSEIGITEQDVQAAIAIRADDRTQALVRQITDADCCSCFSTDSEDESGLLVITGCIHCICRSCLNEIESQQEPNGGLINCPSCHSRIQETSPLKVVREVVKRAPAEGTFEEISELVKHQFKQRQKRTQKEMLMWKQSINELVEEHNERYEQSLEDHTDADAVLRDFEVLNPGVRFEESTENDEIGEDEGELDQHRIVQVDCSSACGRQINYALDIDRVAQLFRIQGVFDDGWKTSDKIDGTMSILYKIWQQSPTDKVIIFSSFTSFLEIFTIPLTAARIPFTMYTGSMSVDERNESLELFRNGVEKVLLISLKAGNVGLTLTSANRVILAEPFWNPYVEDQAKDRVHRIGQSKPVHVYRLFNQDTVEDRIRGIQDKKRKVIGAALDAKASTGGRVTRQDLLYMLGMAPAAA